MTTLLRIDASARTEGSYSRELADVFEVQWLRNTPGGSVVRRDLVEDPIAHIHNDTILGFYTPQAALDDTLRAATTRSDELIDELQAADTLLISTPMYNFSVPSALKAWIDQIVRVGRTFDYNEERGLHGLIENKNAVMITAAGAAYDGTDLGGLDFLNPYLETLFGFLGFSPIEFIRVEGSTTDENVLARTKKQALEQITDERAA